MKSNQKSGADFSFGVREIQQYRRQREQLAIDHGTPAKPAENCGADPYNTSGGFDRRNNWSRVGKR